MAGAIEYITLFSNLTSFGYFMHLGNKWAIDDIANEAQQHFTQSVSDALNLTYASNQIIGGAATKMAEAFDKLRANGWDKMLKIALAVLPLIIILCVIEYLQSGATANAGSVLTDVYFRKFVIRLVVCVGVALSSYFLTKQVLKISASAANKLLTIGGVSFKDAGDLVPFIFPDNLLTGSAGIASEEMEIILVFIRVLFVLMLYLVIIITALLNNLAISILVIVAPLMFIISIYSDIEWVRDLWIKTFIGCVFIPIIDAILLAMIVSYNTKLQGSMRFVEVVESMMFSLGVASIMHMIHESILAGLFKTAADGVGTVKAAVQKVAKLVAAVVTKGASLKMNPRGNGTVQLAKALKGGNQKSSGKKTGERNTNGRQALDKLLKSANSGKGGAQKIAEGEAEKRVKNSSNSSSEKSSAQTNSGTLSPETRKAISKNSSEKAAHKHRLNKEQKSFNEARVDVAMDKLNAFVQKNGYSSIDDYGQKHNLGNNYSLRLADELYDSGGYLMHPMLGNEDSIMDDPGSPLEEYGQEIITNMFASNDNYNDLDTYFDDKSLD